MSPERHANWKIPTNIRFGPGRISELPEACRELGISRPLLVTDRSLRAFPMIVDAQENCVSNGLNVGLFADVDPNPRGSDVVRGVQTLQEGKRDGVVAIGGGSAMDAGKTIAFMAGQTRSMFDFEDRADYWTRADHDAILPVIAVPTTAGTGSEVGRATVILDESDQTKKILFHPNMLPGIVIEDPCLTLGLPSNITAWTGMDALAHCLEAYSSPMMHPIADGIALEGMRLVRNWLPEAFHNRENLEARGNMMIAATMGATAFQKGLGAIHALSHPVGALYGTHHGRTNAIFMPYVLVMNRHAVAEKCERLARYLDLDGTGFDAVLNWILELRQILNIDNTLSDLGLNDSRTDEIVSQGLVDPSAATNPVECTDDYLRSLFLNTLHGNLA